jgi:phage terminase Nu1 subunit (DNA packaging protein)
MPITQQAQQNNGQEVDTDTLSKFLNLQRKEVVALAEEGLFIRTKKNGKLVRDSFDFIRSVRSYVQFLQKRTSTLDLDRELKQEKVFLLRAQREKAEIELQLMRGDVHLASDVERTMTEMLSNFKSKVLAIPHNLARLLVGKTSIAEVADMLKRSMLETLEELRGYRAADFRVHGHIGDRALEFEIMRDDEK